ncbi:hypothetical protein LOTGIDRAFT_122249 [Lottia gigantea]|uniref:NudC domain-containing protein 1 n=1 Tax=Lottia gigantea TaxID=225164 RepID=V4ACM1_LOTGI|nr:hypothetical protein LOTGIDRAFT_122249 [Lottia gigantea]ESO91066.1 hypothetical protein LOTGIDRAFT_122249 [Lottia gigantea]
MAAKVDLKVDRELLDPDFDGYKLSLDPLPVYSTSLDKDVDFAKLTEKQFSYLHSKLYGNYNHLFSDPWNLNTVYYVDSLWNIHQVCLQSENKIESGNIVYSIPDSANLRLIPGRFNVSLCFPSSELAVLSDGTGNLFILTTGNRQSQNVWQFKTNILEEEKCFYHLSDCIYHIDNESSHIECLVIHITDNSEKDEYQTHFTPIIDWITISTGKIKKRRIEDPIPDVKTKDITGRILDYCVFEKTGKAVLLAGDKVLKLTSDSVKPVVTTNSNDDDYEMIGASNKEPRYTWNQTEEDISVQFTVKDNVKKSDIYFIIKPDYIELGIKNSNSHLLYGKLYRTVDTEACTWTITGQRLELTLCKTDSSTWKEVVEGDASGELVLDSQQIEAIHQRLEAFTSDQMNPDPDCGNRVYNSQELEDCDLDTGMILMRIDGETHQITHQVSKYRLNQWLFTVKLEPGKPKSLCLRHDVDGCMWQPTEPVSSGVSPWQHVVTFDALGYVQASKQQKKYSSSAPNCSYSVICDCSKHLYIYHRHSPINSPLRNRKTGKQVNTIAKQQVISLDTTDAILGLHAANDKIFILTETSLYVIKISSDI